MKNYFQKLIYLLLLVGFSTSIAGSYDEFFKAIKQDNPQVITDLIKRGFDGNVRDEKGQHALYLALREPSPKAAEALLAWKDLDVNALNKTDESALMLAALRGQLDIAKLLIDKDADVNKTGWAPLHYAATGGHVDIISLLLEHHAYIDAESPNKTTPLMMAAQYGSPTAVKLLLDEGADPLLKNEQGLSALDFAQKASRQDAAELIAATVRAKQPKGQW